MIQAVRIETGGDPGFPARGIKYRCCETAKLRGFARAASPVLLRTDGLRSKSLTEPEKKETPMEYFELLSPQMQGTLNAAGYTTPTPIQEQSLKPLLENRDLVGVAQTGTGKTAAFAVPVIERLSLENKKVQALILCPTRELAQQTTAVFRKLSAHNTLRTVCIYGGQSPNVQIRALRGGAQIVVGTPGRVRDMIERHVLNLANVRVAILDEADEMLDFGFLPDIKNIMSYVTGKHQTMLFSATMNGEVAKVARQFLRDPLRVEIGKRDEPVETVAQTFIMAEEPMKTSVVKYVLNEAKPRLTLVFCNTRNRVRHVSAALNRNGIAADCLHGDLTQKQRDVIMEDFRNAKSTVLVATDVAARGIDVTDIDLVINYDVPDKPDYYVHRIGRTGRAGRRGLACTLISERDKARMQEIKKQYRIVEAT